MLSKMMEALTQARVRRQVKGNAFLVWVCFLFSFWFFLGFVFVNSWAHSSSLGVRWRDPKINAICGQRSVNPGPEKTNLKLTVDSCTFKRI